jgi:dipeptidyl aminopeptidase/acylaminoacyl peptidase
MTRHDDLERLLAAWADEGPLTSSPRNLAAVVERTRHLRQRPAGRLGTWLPTALVTRPIRAHRATWPLVAALAIAVAIGAVIVGARMLRSDDVDRVVPAPAGGVRNGLIAFESGGDIWVAGPDGSDARPFVTGPTDQRGPSWSPDGTMLAYFEMTALGPGPFDDRALIRVIGADGTGDHTVTCDLPVLPARYMPDTTFWSPLAWSPDSASLATAIFQTGIYDNEADPWTCPDAGRIDDSWLSELAEVFDDPRLSLTPSGDRFRLNAPGSLSGEPNEQVVLFMRADGSGVTAYPGQHVVDPSWSPDGLRLATKGVGHRFSTPGFGVWVSTLDAETLQVVSLAVNPMAQGCGLSCTFAFAAPQWSPDGEALAYFCCVSGDNDVWVVGEDGTGGHRLTDDAQDDYWPSWSPDGSLLAYLRTPPGESTPEAGSQVVLVEPDGVIRRTLDEPVVHANGPPVWAPDGRALLVMTKPTLEGAWRPTIISADGSSGPIVLDQSGGDAVDDNGWMGLSWQRLGPPDGPS